MKRTTYGSMVLALGLGLLMGCGGSGSGGADDPSGKGGKGPTTGSGEAVTAEALQAFNAGLDSMRKHDEANDWSDQICADTAAQFIKAEDEQGGKGFLEARYNAGVAYQRCKNDAEAKKIFGEILDKNPKYHRARVQMALYAFKEGGEKDVEGAISEMQRAVRDAEYNNIEALVQLAMLQMRRQSTSSDEDGANDLERAKKNLQRALAINDGFMPAFNQLAIYYMQRAKEAAGKTRGRVAAAVGKEKKADTAALDLADLVVSQAIRKNPNYGPVYNTSGLIRAELGDLSGAAQAFGKARQLDPKFFEAHMNYAAVNLQFRGFQQAEAAYRDAIKLRPKDYEAHLGLALAIRGQINDANVDQKFGEALKELGQAKQLDASRAETYYNEAILVQEFKTRMVAPKGEKEQEKALLEARGIFDQFIGKASGKKEFDDAVKRSKERQKDIDDIVAFNKQSAEERKRLEEMQKQQAAQDQLKQSGGGGEAPPEGEPAP